MDLRTLRCFVEVAREKSFTAAAEKLFVTQPSLSRRIAELEDELGVALFDRSTRRVALTEKGLRLMHEAELILAHVERAKLEVMREEGFSGEIRIAAAETPGMRIVARAAARMQAEHPLMTFHFVSKDGPEAAEELRLGLCDFGVFMLPADLDGFETIELPYASRWGVLVSRSDVLAQQRVVRPADLEGRAVWISRNAFGQPVIARRVAGWLGAPLSALDVRGTYNLLFNAAFMAESGSVVLGLEGIAPEMPGEGGTVFLPLEPELRFGVVFARAEARPRKPETEAFVAVLREEIERALRRTSV